MNCLEFRRTTGADPSSQAGELAAHASECAACTRYRDELRSMDRLIRRALEVETDARTAHPVAKGQWQRRWALAASLVMTLCLGFFLWLSNPRETLAEQLVAHVEGEPQSLVRTPDAVEPGLLNDILARSGVRMKPGAGTVSYAMSCWFRGHFVPHLVVQSDRGPITVLLLTREQSVKRREVFHEGGFQGVVLPAPRGALAVLGRDTQAGQAAEQVAERFLQAVEYQP